MPKENLSLNAMLYQRPLYLAELVALASLAERRAEYVMKCKTSLDMAQRGYDMAREDAAESLMKLEDFIERLTRDK